MMKKKKEYALYRDDEFLCVGQKKELAKYLGVKETTITSYCCPSHWKNKKSGYIVIQLED